MPRRNKEQQVKHNEARREFAKKGKRALFCLDYVKNRNPDLVKKANDMYDYLLERYPNKRDLLKTDEYKGMKMIDATASKSTPSETVVSYHQPDTTNPTPNEPIGFNPQPATNNPTSNEPLGFYPQHNHRTTTEPQYNQIEPQLEIPLLKIPLHIKDIIPQTPATNQQYIDETIQQSTDLLTELRQDPDLKWLFSDEPANNSLLEGIDPMCLDQEGFDLSDYDLPDILFEEDELSRLACM